MIIVVKACDFGYKVYGARLLLCLVVIAYFREVIPESEVCILPISSVMNLSISCGLPWDVFSLGVAVTVRAEKAKAANNVYFFI